jgi:hypothetical protein
VGWIAESAREAAASGASRLQPLPAAKAKTSARSAGASRIRATVAGCASSSSAPLPARSPPREKTRWATWAATSATPPAQERKTATPAP